jgi:hypothetical protein
MSRNRERTRGKWPQCGPRDTMFDEFRRLGIYVPVDDIRFPGWQLESSAEWILKFKYRGRPDICNSRFAESSKLARLKPRLRSARIIL